MMAREAALKAAAKGKVCRLLPYNKSFYYMDVKMGYSAVNRKSQSKKCASLARAGRNSRY